MSNSYEGNIHYKKGKRKWHNFKQNIKYKLKRECSFSSEQQSVSSNSQRMGGDQETEEDLGILC